MKIRKAILDHNSASNVNKKNILKNLRKTNNSGVRKPKLSCPRSNKPGPKMFSLQIEESNITDGGRQEAKKSDQNNPKNLADSKIPIQAFSPDKLNKMRKDVLDKGILAPGADGEVKERSTYRSLRNFISGTFFNKGAIKASRRHGGDDHNRANNAFSNSRRRCAKKFVSDKKISNVSK